MNENVEKQNRSEQLRAITQRWLVYLGKTSLYAFGIAALIGISFLFTGDFSAKTYSDRLFTAGILITMVGVFVFITMAGTRKNMGLPTIAKTEVDARKIMDRTQELIDKAEKRYDAGSQVWAVGIACLVLSILSYFLLSIFKF
jgi:sugar phosphate permease